MTSAHIARDINHLSKSNTKEQIYQNLLARGYSLEQIQQGFLELKNHNNSNSNKNQPQNSSQGIYIIAIFGAVLLGIGIFSLIAANWSSIPDLTKVLIVLFLTILLHGLGLVASYKFKLKNISNTLYLAGSLAFGGCLFLITQLYTLPFKWSDFYLVWFIGVSILGLVLKNFVQEYLGLFVLILTSTFSYGFFGGFYYSPVLENNNYLTIILAFVATIISIYWAKNLRLRNPDSTLNNIF